MKFDVEGEEKTRTISASSVTNVPIDANSDPKWAGMKWAPKKKGKAQHAPTAAIGLRTRAYLDARQRGKSQREIERFVRVVGTSVFGLTINRERG